MLSPWGLGSDSARILPRCTFRRNTATMCGKSSNGGGRYGSPCLAGARKLFATCDRKSPWRLRLARPRIVVFRILGSQRCSPLQLEAAAFLEGGGRLLLSNDRRMQIFPSKYLLVWDVVTLICAPLLLAVDCRIQEGFLGAVRLAFRPSSRASLGRPHPAQHPSCSPGWCTAFRCRNGLGWHPCAPPASGWVGILRAPIPLPGRF